MGVIADLMVRVGTELQGFRTGMGEVDQRVEQAGGGFGKLGAFALGAGAAAAAAVTGIVAFGVHSVDSAMNAGQAAFEMSEKFGLLPEKASAWLAVGGQLGLSNEQISKGFQFLSKNTEAMQFTLESGGKIAKATIEPYKELGINVLTAGGKVKDANTLMLEAADAFKRLPDGPEKAALALKLFGRAGTDLLPMLNAGSDGIRGMMEEAKKAGVVMSAEAIQGAHEMYLQHKRLDQAMAGVTMQIGVFLMPIMIKLMDFAQNTAIPTLRLFATYFREHIYPALVQVYAGFMQLIGPALAYIQSHFEDLKPVLVAIGIVALIALGVIVVAIGLVVSAVVGLVFIITWLSGQLRANADSWAANVQNFVIGALTAFGNFISFVYNMPGRVRDSIASTAIGMWDGIWNAFRSMLNRIIGAWNGLHFSIGGGNFAGVDIPGVYLGVPQLPYFHQGGIVPGSRDILAVLQGGERVLSRSEAQNYDGAGKHIHIHIDQGAYIDGPSIDMLTNKLAQRLQFASGI